MQFEPAHASFLTAVIAAGGIVAVVAVSIATSKRTATDVERHAQKLELHGTRIATLETATAVHEERLDNLEGK